MSVESLLACLPPQAVYRRDPLEGDRNALEPWREAVGRFVKPDDEQDVWGELIFGSREGGHGDALLTVDQTLARQVLDRNAAALELLCSGVQRGRVQFPEVHQLEQVPGDSEFIYRLGELARLPFIRFKVLAAGRDWAAATEEIIRLLRIGEMICNGEGQVLHYLIGLWIRSAAQRAIAQLAGARHVPRPMLVRLLDAVQQTLRSPDGLSQSLRIDFCAVVLPQFDQTKDEDDLPAIVDRILEVYYSARMAGTEQPSGPPSGAGATGATGAAAWLAHCRRQIVRLLEGHPKPFDKSATVRLMGETIAERVQDLTAVEKPGFLDFVGKLRRVRMRLHREHLTQKTRYWPEELTPDFPYESYDFTQPPDATSAEPSPTNDEILAAREKLREVANPIGLLLVDHILSFDYTSFMLEHRAKLQDTRKILVRQIRQRE
jgi:hypothetical protein